MDVQILPSSLHGVMQVPPSKSMAHRLFICATLAQGVSCIRNLDYSVDIQATAMAMQQLGATITQEENAATVVGTGGMFSMPQQAVNCHESGSTFRLILPLFSLLGAPVVFTGAPRLLERPHKVYADIFAEQNLLFEQTKEKVVFQGPLKSGEYTVAGNVSSQFISGLLFLLPLLSEDSVLHITSPFESRAYVELTRQAQLLFGVHSTWQDENTLCIKGAQQYIATDCTVEGDWSQAAVPAVLGGLLGGISVKGLSATSAQGDKVILDILDRCGIPFFWQDGVLVFPSKSEQPLAAGDIDMANCPDLGPMLSTLGAFCEGETRLVNAARLRIKESDRIATMEEELGKLGVKISSTPDTLMIEGPSVLKNEQVSSSHNDHRIVMALSAAALLGGKTLTIENAQAITKSWPNFFEDLKEIGAKVVLYE